MTGVSLVSTFGHTMKPEEQQFLNDLDKRLWTMANKLLPMLDAAVYKHVVLGLIFLKYVSDAFKERRTELIAGFRAPTHEYYLGEDGEDLIEQELEARDYYVEKNVFWVPALARWDFLQANAKVALGTVLKVRNGKITEYKFNGIGRLLDDALEAVEKENPKLKGVLEKDYARKQIATALPGLIDLIAEIPFQHGTLKAKDILGHVYEYFLGEFAMAEGKKGGQYYTPKSSVTLIVEMLEPYRGRVYDPCCGSGGFFVQSEKFVEEHGGRIGQISVYVKEWNAGVKDDDPRWKYGIPPAGNANFAWMQHMFHLQAPHGSMALLLAIGSMSSNTNNEGEIRKAIIEADLVECMVALPGQLFTNSQIPACIWFLAKNKKARPDGTGHGAYRDRSGEVLFIDARNKGYMKDRVLRDFAMEDIAAIASTYHKWKMAYGAVNVGNGYQAIIDIDEDDLYQDIAGFCKAAKLEAIRKHDFVLTPGRYVGATEQEADAEPFEDKMARLTAQLNEQFDESARLEAVIRENLARLGYGL